MPPHLLQRSDRGNMFYIVDGHYYRSTKTNKREIAEKLLEEYERNRFAIADSLDLGRKAKKLLKRFGRPDTITRMGRLRFPCVYAFIRDGEIVYVGSSINGFARVIASHHPMVLKSEDSDQIAFWMVDSEAEAREMELKIIRELKPKFNCDANGALKVKGFNQRAADPMGIKKIIQQAIRAELKKFQIANAKTSEPL